MIPLLLEADAQIDAQDNYGKTPLIWASMNGEEAAVRELLKGNPNLDLKSNSGKTALDDARKKNHQSIVDLLVDHERSPDPDLIDDGTGSPESGPMLFSRSSALIGPVFQLSEEGKVATKVGTEGCKIGGSWGADWQNNLVLRPAHSGGVKTMSFTTPDSGCVGVVQVKKMPAGQPEEEPDPFQCYATSTTAGKDIGWFFTVHGGALCGNGMEDSNATGSCYNKVITVKADLDSGAITFYVDGKRCGPGFPTGVNGPLCFAVNAAKVGQRISIVPDPDLID